MPKGIGYGKKKGKMTKKKTTYKKLDPKSVVRKGEYTKNKKKK